MYGLFSVWLSKTRIISIFALAGIYFLLAIGFRLLNSVSVQFSVLPVVFLVVSFALLFGFAGIWGSATGFVTVEVALQTFGPTTAFGYLGILLIGMVTYQTWEHLPAGVEMPPDIRAWPQVRTYLLLAVFGALTYGSTVAWGAEALGVYPFSVVFVSETVPNLLVAVILGPVTVNAFAPVLRRRNLGLAKQEGSQREMELTPHRDRSIWVLLAVSLFWAVSGYLVSVVYQSLNSFESTVLFVNLYSRISAIEWVVNAPGPRGRWLIVCIGVVSFSILWGMVLNIGPKLPRDGEGPVPYPEEPD